MFFEFFLGDITALTPNQQIYIIKNALGIISPINGRYDIESVALISINLVE